MKKTAIITEADFKLIVSISKRISSLLPKLPIGDLGNKEYNAYRLLKRTELPRLQRKIEKLEKEFG